MRRAKRKLLQPAGIGLLRPLNKFTCDIWGNTVNIASRTESLGAVGKVYISHDLDTKLADLKAYTFTPRGAVEVKDKGFMDVYFVDR